MPFFQKMSNHLCLLPKFPSLRCGNYAFLWEKAVRLSEKPEGLNDPCCQVANQNIDRFFWRGKSAYRLILVSIMINHQNSQQILLNWNIPDAWPAIVQAFLSRQLIRIDTRTDERTDGRTDWVTLSLLELLIAAKNQLIMLVQIW